MMERKSWIYYLQDEKYGTYEVEGYITKSAAITAAEYNYERATKDEKKRCWYAVFQTDEFDDDGEPLLPDAYDTIWENGEEVD